MATVIISEDQNTVIDGEKKFIFNKLVTEDVKYNICGHCAAFTLCCKLQKSTNPETNFPFPCVERKDGDEGNFQSE